MAGTARARRADPYRVWLSEIMLQQTTVKTVAPYYARFLATLPDGRARSRGRPLDEVLQAVGRARLLRARPQPACLRQGGGRAVTAGAFPTTEAALRALPGIGAYTAAAIAAIAFDRPATPVDGNIERVIARLFAVEAGTAGGQAGNPRLAARD